MFLNTASYFYGFPVVGIGKNKRRLGKGGNDMPETALSSYKPWGKEIFPFLLTLLILCTVSSFPARASDLDGVAEKIKEHVSGGVIILLRNELWSTFEKEGVSTERTYDFFFNRTRGFIDLTWEEFTIHLMGQGVKAFNLPKNAAFGLGPLYFSASDEETDPGNFQPVEAYLHIKDIQGFYLKGGRIGFNDGAQVLYKDDLKLNWLIQARLSERLIGNWDWPIVGRRYDGGTLGYTNNIFDFNLFGANVTFGGFDVDDGLWKDLDTVVVTGGAFTLKKDVLVPNTQFQIFNYFYFDDRTSARGLAGSDLEINTTGMSIIGAYNAGPGQVDLMLWFAFQLGNFGDLNQGAFAFIAELGYQFLELPWKPWLRAGIAYASGDGDPDDSDNGTFFNMVPTNHKWYGYTDSFAFMNLINPTFQLLLTPHEKVKFLMEGNAFFLSSDEEEWVTGSGPFNNEAFGYVFRAPVPGRDIERNMGAEVGFTLSIRPIDFLYLDIGYYHLFGGEGVESVFDKEDQLDWFYAQATVQFNLGK